MFVSYIRGVPDQWAGHARHIHHYVSKDLVNWDHRGPLALSSDRVIDAAVHPHPGGGYRMWYKDEADGSSTGRSTALTWKCGTALSESCGHRAVMRARTSFGSAVLTGLSSTRGTASWPTAQTTCPIGARRAGSLTPPVPARAVVKMTSARACIATWLSTAIAPSLFTSRSRGGPTRPGRPYPARRSSVLAAELGAEDGELVCDRGRDITLALSDEAV